jgi:hypothetical protein
MEIEKQVDELTIERWTFTWIDKTIFLDKYVLLQKESKRKRIYSRIKHYDRIMGRNSTIKESDVPLSEDLKAEVLAKFIANIRVIKWEERKNSYS